MYTSRRTNNNNKESSLLTIFFRQYFHVSNIGWGSIVSHIIVGNSDPTLQSVRGDGGDVESGMQLYAVELVRLSKYINYYLVYLKMIK